MRQTTLPEQTAKLIELGFDRPKNRVIKQLLDRSTDSWITIGEEGDYSIGELIEFIGIGTLKIRRDADGCWWVAYKNIATNKDDNRINSIWSADYEIIDALYDMIVKLKEEGVI